MILTKEIIREETIYIDNENLDCCDDEFCKHCNTKIFPYFCNKYDITLYSNGFNVFRCKECIEDFGKN